MNKSRIAAFAMLMLVFAGAPLWSVPADSYASVGFMGLSPALTDTIAAWSIKDTLYGGTVSFAVNRWFTLGAEVLYLGDIYYGKNSSNQWFGPVSWTALKANDPSAAGTQKADWTYYESLIYAPLTFNLTIPLGFVKPYVGGGPAFYFHFPSTNQDAAFTNYLSTHYGLGGRIRTGITARAGLHFYFGSSFSIDVGYLVREDVPSMLFDDLAEKGFYLENGYAFVAARLVLD